MYHKETKENEVWVGNTNTNGDLGYLKSIKHRLGKQAYSIHNEKIPTDYMLPLFIHKDDYKKYDYIMVELSKKARYGR